MRWMLPVVALTAILGTMTATNAIEKSTYAAGARSAAPSSAASENVAVVTSPAEAARAGEYWNVERMEKAAPMPLPEIAGKAPEGCDLPADSPDRPKDCLAK